MAEKKQLRAVPSFYFSLAKEQLSILNQGQTLVKMAAIFLVTPGRVWSKLPQVKRPWFWEWPWRSKKSATSVFQKRRLSPMTSGCSFLLEEQNLRLRSAPEREHLEFPTMTPSGFSIGTTLKTNRLRRQSAQAESPRRNQSSPFTMQEPTVSAGWHRAVITMLCLESSRTRSDISSRSTRLPASVRHSPLRRQCLGCQRSSSWSSIDRSEQVQGTAQAKCTRSLVQTKTKSQLREQCREFCAVREQVMFQPPRNQSLPSVRCRCLLQAITRMPCWYSDFLLYRFTMLNLTRWPFTQLPTLKKNHWQNPFELVSFCRTRLYSCPQVTSYTRCRLPLSNRLSNCSSPGSLRLEGEAGLGSDWGQTSLLPDSQTTETPFLMTVRLTEGTRETATLLSPGVEQAVIGLKGQCGGVMLLGSIYLAQDTSLP